MQLTYSKTLDVTLRSDVLVCGAGCAGIGAAVAAARAGAILEQTANVPVTASVTA